MQSHLQRNAKLSQMKERMQQKLKAQQQQREAAALVAASATTTTEGSNGMKIVQPQVFSTGEVVERTPIEAPRPSNSNKKKKKK
jgi:hypothetical protein